MHSLKLFVTLFIFVMSEQNIESKILQKPNPENNLMLPTALILAKNDKYLTYFKDEWQKVKISIIIAWNHVKVVANNAKTKINGWVASIKKHAEEISQSFEEKLKTLKLEVHDVINKIFGDGKVVKECIKQEANEIKNAFNDIIQRMSSCLRRNIGSHSILRTGEEPMQLNETKFMERLEEDVQLCKKDPGNVEECLTKVKESVVNDIQNIETNFYSLQTESRIVVDKLLDALVACSINGLVEAMSIAVTEVLNITKCVIQGSENKIEIMKEN